MFSNYAVLLLQDAFFDASLAEGVGFVAMSLWDLSMCPLQWHQACTELQERTTRAISQDNIQTQPPSPKEEQAKSSPLLRRT